MSFENPGERTAMTEKRAQVLVAIPEEKARQSVLKALHASAAPFKIAVVHTFQELESAACCALPDMVIMSEEIVGVITSLCEATRRIAIFAPIVVIASPEKQQNLVGLVASGEVDIVTDASDYSAVVTALVERRLSSPPICAKEFGSAWSADVPSDFAEILRHEINNPLTGILGNAELLLSQLREKLPPASVQRLETVVDLAVRLREKIRCLAGESNASESRMHSVSR